MNRALKVLAIVMLVITVAGAGVVLYGLTMLAPQAENVSVIATPAVQVQDTFDAVMAQLSDGTFAGKQHADAHGLLAQDCTFLTYTVRLANKGFFPAEWLNLQVAPKMAAGSADILQLADDRAYVLAAGTKGDLGATILCAGDAGDTARQLKITCYVFGQKVEFTVDAR